MKESGKECLKSTIYESTLSTAPRSPFPDGEGLGGATLRVDFYKGRCPKVVGIAIRGKRISNIRGSQPRLATPHILAPSSGRGENVGRFECIYPSFLWKEVPAGRRLEAQSGVKDDVRLCVFPSSPVSTHFTAVNVSDFVSSERV